MLSVIMITPVKRHGDRDRRTREYDHDMIIKRDRDMRILSRT